VSETRKKVYNIDSYCRCCKTFCRPPLTLQLNKLLFLSGFYITLIWFLTSFKIMPGMNCQAYFDNAEEKSSTKLAPAVVANRQGIVQVGVLERQVGRQRQNLSWSPRRTAKIVGILK
jgi:hypothetical protein